MDKMHYTPIAGKFRPLNFSIEVMFDAAEKFGGMAQAFEIIDKENREGVAAIKWFIVHMANDAELVRRQEGYENDPMLTEDDVEIQKPWQYVLYKNAVLSAIDIGYHRDVEDPKEEIDLGLQELNAKKEKAGD